VHARNEEPALCLGVSLLHRVQADCIAFAVQQDRDETVLADRKFGLDDMSSMSSGTIFFYAAVLVGE
jgi:hypothetical protein